MAMVETDEFGDLYADLEGQVNIGFDSTPSIRQLYPEEVAKIEAVSGDDDVSGDEEQLLYDHIGDETGRSDEKLSFPASEVKVNEGSGAEEGEYKLWEGESYDSDSEDDLHIVLNEDCSNFPPSQRIGFGNVVEGDAGEEVEDEVAIGTGEDPMNKDQKWAEPSQFPADGVEQSHPKGGAYLLPYSQYKYVRSHSARYPSTTKGVEPGGAFSCSISSSGNWDVNGGNQLATSCTGIPAEVQSAFGFYLPRNKTIFDISIEMFDRKPWRNQGVDISDFFNFGLDEESWKHYCESLHDLFQKQTTWLSRVPIYKSSRQNQIIESGHLRQAAFTGTTSGEVSHSGHEGKTASVMEKPKGRAIQVEGGIGERRPSMDTRRPRHQDSDVVIQITREDSVEDDSLSCKQELEPFDDFVLNSNDGVRKGSFITSAVYKLSPRHCDDVENQAAVNCDEPKVNVIRESNEEAKVVSDSKENDVENTARMDVSVALTESVSGDHVLCNSSPSYIESHSEASGDSLDKVHGSKKSSLGSVTELQDSFISDLSNDSKSDNGNTEREDGKLGLEDDNLIQEEQNCCSGTRPHQAAKNHVSKVDDESIYSYKKGRRDSDFLKVNCGRKERNFGYNVCNEEDLSSYRQNKTSSLSYGSRRCAERQVSGSFHLKYFPREDDPRSCNREDYLLGRRAFRDHDIKLTESHFHGDGQKCREAEVVDHKRYIHAAYEHTSLPMEDWYSLQRKKSVDDHRSRMATHDFRTENRYREGYVHRCYERHLAYSDREEDIRLDKFDRRGQYSLRALRSSTRRENHEQRLCFELDDSLRYIKINSRHSHRRSSSDAQPFRESHTISRRGFHDGSPPRKHMHMSQRSEQYMDHWRPANIRDVQVKKQREKGLVDSSGMEHCFSSKRKDLDFDIGYYSPEELVYPQCTGSIEKTRYTRLSEVPHMIDGEVNLRHPEQVDAHSPETYFLHERRLRHENSFKNHNPVSDGNLSDGHLLGNLVNGITARRYTDFEAMEQNYTMKCRETVRGPLKCCEEKFLRRCSKVAVKRKKQRKKQRDTGHRMDTGQQDFSHTEGLDAWTEVHPHRPKMDGPHIHVLSSKVVIVGQCSSEHCANQSTENWHDKHAVVQDQDISALEEGQIIEEPEDEDVGTLTKDCISKTVLYSVTDLNLSDNKEENKKDPGSSHNSKLVGAYDNGHILETLAKMEKRRERFKEPIAPKKGPEKILNSQVMVETAEVKPERPTRKRRWRGS